MIESNRAIYFEDDIGASQGLREIVFKEHLVFIPMPIASTPISSLVVDQHPVATNDDEPIENVDLVTLDIVMEPMRRLERARRLAISNDYIVYLQDHEYDVGRFGKWTTSTHSGYGPKRVELIWSIFIWASF